MHSEKEMIAIYKKTFSDYKAAVKEEKADISYSITLRWKTVELLTKLLAFEEILGLTEEEKEIIRQEI